MPYSTNLAAQVLKLEREIDEDIRMLPEGIIEHPITQWASPMLLVQNKSYPRLMICVEYRRFKSVTGRDSYGIQVGRPSVVSAKERLPMVKTLCRISKVQFRHGEGFLRYTKDG